MSPPEPTAAVVAVADLVGRSGGRRFEIGYLDDDPDRPDWWATVTYDGAKLTAERHATPSAAADALARLILEGGRCTHCGHTVTLRRANAGRAPRRTNAPRQCRWRRIGDRWVRGCA
jgi:hypothetical protein